MDASYIIRYFDADEDGELTYQDLLQMVMPCDDEYLRASVAQKHVQQVHKSNLGSEIQIELTRLFEK